MVVAPPSVYERPASPAVLTAPGRFGVGEVRGTVERFTGHRLEVEKNRDGLVDLSPDGPDAFGSLGSFNLYVARDRRTRDALVRRWGKLFGPPYRDHGVRFLPQGGPQATAAFGDTVYLASVTSGSQIDDRFRRLVRALGALGAPAASERGRPPPEQRPCPPGITRPGALEERTCRLGTQSATFVDRDATLALPGVRLRVLAVEHRDRLGEEGDVSPPERPAGRYVVLRVRVENTAGRERRVLDDLRAELEIDERRFTRAVGELRAYDDVEDIPSRVGPGEEGEALFVFDVPPPQAARAERDGTLVLTGRTERPFEDAPDSPRTSPTVARLRLRPR